MTITRTRVGASGKVFDSYRIVSLGYVYHTASAATALDQGVWTEIAGTFGLSPASDSTLTKSESGTGVVYNGTEAGRVLVWAEAALNAAGAGAAMALGVCIDDAIITDGDHGHVVDSATGDAHVSVVAMVSVSPGQKVSVRLLNHTNGADATVIHLGMVVAVVA